MNSHSFTSKDIENSQNVPDYLKNLDTNNIEMYQKEGKLNFEETAAKKDFTKDLNRGTIIHLKKEGKLDRIIDEEIAENIAKDNQFTDNQRDELKSALLDKVEGSFKNYGISKEQSDYIKTSTQQGAVGALGGGLFIGLVALKPEGLPTAQVTNGSAAQIEIKGGNLIYKSIDKVLFDHDITQGNFGDYGIATYSKVDSKDYIISTVEINLGKVGDKNFTPKLECHFCAEGETGNLLLNDIKQVKSTINPKNPDLIKQDYLETRDSLMEESGKNKEHDKLIKEAITTALKENDTDIASPLKNISTTEKMLPSALADHIDNVLKYEPKNNSYAVDKLINDTSNVVSEISGKPKGYVKILMKDVISERAKEKNINVPKEGFIEKISDTIKLLYYSAKGENKSQDLDKFRKTPIVKKSSSLGR
ncbi:MAG TPA: hypothetical protein QKA08_03575 [Candidatus Megaira endosymbiont of Nemacystus decipiens]|nr:hypothetical protein [Candidatus Megaera endosymbiont of Nemacystus decipiens]